MLSAASSASLNKSSLTSKYDHGGYSYLGRSYGVGTTAGLVDETIVQRHGMSELLSYSYQEPGYNAQVSCIHNASQDFHFQPAYEGEPGYGIPAFYYAIGRFPLVPDEHTDFFAVVGNPGDNSIFASMMAKSYSDVYAIMITGGMTYNILRDPQCEVQFQRTMFQVDVDVTNKFVLVSPLTNHGATTSSDFDSTKGLSYTVMGQVNALSMIITSTYTSLFGLSLINNMAATQRDFNASSAKPSERTLNATQDSMTAMIDVVLEIIGGRYVCSA